MKRIAMTIIIMFCMTSCQNEDVLLVQPPDSPPADYPSTLKYSQERWNSFMNILSQFKHRYPSAVIGPIDTLLMVPEYIRSIDLFPDQIGIVQIDSVQFRLRNFMFQWHDLFNTSPVEMIDGEKRGSSSGRYTITFKKSMPNSQTEGYDNTVFAQVTNEGVIQSFSSRCAPSLSIPMIIHADIAKAVKAITGKQILFYSWTGVDTSTITPQSISNAELTTLRLRQGQSSSAINQSIEYRYCWKFTTPIFYVYVDAITGKDLDYAELYAIF